MLEITDLLATLNSMRQKEILTDVTLVISGLEIKAHKNILAARSPYFFGMFAGGNYFLHIDLIQSDIATEV